MVCFQGTPGAGGACWRKVCVSVCFGAVIIHVLFYFLFSNDLPLHAAFPEDIGKHLMFFCLILL